MDRFNCDKLSKREVEVLRALYKVDTLQEVGEALVLERATISAHLANIYNKLCVSSKHRAIVVAQELGYL